MVNEFELKKMMVEVGRRIWTRGYVAANDGNITVLLNDNELLTTPTGVSKGFMTPDMIIKVNREGKVISGSSKYKPSSEVKMHLDVYRERPDIRSVVHAHPPYATSFAVAGIPLDKCVLPEAILVIGSVPIAPYGLPSTMEIPERARPFIRESDAILLENHGALTLGSSLMDAYHKMETLEHTANIVWKAVQLGNVNVLDQKERDRLLGLRDNYGLQGRVTACDVKPMTTPSAPPAQSDRPSVTANPNEQSIKEIVEKVLQRLSETQ